MIPFPPPLKACPPPPSQLWGELVGGFFMAVYVVFMVVHHSYKFVNILWVIAFLLSIATMIINVSALIFYMVKNADTDGLDNLKYIAGLITFTDWHWPSPIEV